VWRYLQERRARWALLAGSGVGLMWATKETFVIALAAILFAFAATWLWRRHSEWRRAMESGEISAFGEEDPTQVGRRSNVARNGKHFALALGAGALVWAVLFSSFFTNLDGLADSFRTYLPWLRRAGG
jgi:hypothetical protein